MKSYGPIIYNTQRELFNKGEGVESFCQYESMHQAMGSVFSIQK